MQTWIYQIYSLLKGQSTVIISEEAVAMVQETVRQLVKAIKVRKPVLVQQDQVSRVVRCLYTDVFLREVSQIEIPRLS